MPKDTRSATGRLLIDAPNAGAWNMAVDEVLLASAEERGITTLRFYGWSEPTLSLGYFQAYDERLVHRPSRHLPLVRRASGGGAIIHDRELTYSLALPRVDRLDRRAQRLYDEVHRAIASALATRAVQARAVADSSKSPSGGQPFLCFQRHMPGDLLVAGHKVAGSAQRRSGNAVLQHGSLLLAASDAAPELPGIREASRISIDARQLVVELTRSIVQGVGLEDFTEQPLSPHETEEARELAISKYGCLWWNRRR